MGTAAKSELLLIIIIMFVGLLFAEDVHLYECTIDKSQYWRWGNPFGVH